MIGELQDVLVVANPLETYFRRDLYLVTVARTSKAVHWKLLGSDRAELDLSSQHVEFCLNPRPSRSITSGTSSILVHVLFVSIL